MPDDDPYQEELFIFSSQNKDEMGLRLNSESDVIHHPNPFTDEEIHYYKQSSTTLLAS